MKTSFEKRLVLFFTIIFIGIIVAGIVSYLSDKAAADTDERMDHSKEVIYGSEEVLSLAKDIVLDTRGYLITNDSVFLENFAAAKNSIFGHIEKLKDLTEDNNIQQLKIDSLNNWTRARIAFYDHFISARAGSGVDAAAKIINSREGLIYAEGIKRIVAEIQAVENDLLVRQREADNKSIAAFNYAFFALLAFIVFLLVAIFFTIRYYLEARTKAEEKIKSTNAFLDTILDNIPDMIFIKDARHLRFVRFNKAGEKLLGYDRNVLIGKNDYFFFPKEQADFFTAKDRDVLNSGKLIDIPEEPISSINGESWLHTKKIPIMDDKGSPAYLLGISEDITERKKQEDRIKQLNEELELNLVQLKYMNKELEAYSYSITHDLLAPLQIIDSHTEAIAKTHKERLDPDTHKQLDLIRDNSGMIRQLIDDLVNLSQLNRKELDIHEVKMDELVAPVIREQKMLNAAHSFELKTGKLEPVRCEGSLIRLVWRNLISNAFKYSAGKDKSLIEIGSFKKDRHVVYFVKDNGVGFDMKKEDKLFDVFQRIHETTEAKGNGGALAIAQRIVQKHGGKVWAEAEVGNGAVFYFSLPLSG